ncbi:MAG: hypothetical protein LWW79_07695 [Holophagaceae bacterium]|nr:hypothetical protein [Holophagaceae bacterium]
MQAEPSYSELQWPDHRWSLLSAQAWVRGLQEVQVPEFTEWTAEELAARKQTLPTLDPKVVGVTKYQLELQAAGLEWEWALQSQMHDQRWKAGYRTDYTVAWQPVTFGEKAAESKPGPDHMLILVAAHQITPMLEQLASSMLVLQPGTVVQKDSKAVIELMPGPCLTLVQGFLTVLAHVPLESLPVLPLAEPASSFQLQAQAEIAAARDSTQRQLGAGSYWIPQVHAPLTTSVQRY